MENKHFLKLAIFQAEALLNVKTDTNRAAAAIININAKRKRLKSKIKKSLRKIFRSKRIKPESLQVLINVRGGIGDVAMARIFAAKLRQNLPQAEIYFRYDSKEVVKMIFPETSCPIINGYVSKIYIEEDYDIVYSGCHIFVCSYWNEERVMSLAPEFMPAMRKCLEMTGILKISEANTPYLDGYLANFIVSLGFARVSGLGLSTGLLIDQNDRAPLPLSGNAFKILSDAGLCSDLGEGILKYITIHNGINENTKISGTYLTRNWPKKRWAEFCEKFKTAFPDIKIVQLGGSKAEPFDFVHISLIGNTSLSDLPYILGNSLLHIDGETGMAHLANHTDTVSIVLFGPSRKKYLGYERNINIESSKCTGCMNIDKYWTSRCLMGYSEEESCLSAIPAEKVFEAAEKYLKNSKKIDS